MEINEKLQKAGLTGNEAKVYLELLKRGGLSANQVAKNLGMDRTLTYTILNNLIEKGQVNYVVKENKKFFSISNPENLMNQIKAKEFLVLDLIKDLKKIKPLEQKETIINIYDGKEGFRVMMNLVKNEKEFFAFGSTGRAFYQFYEMPAIAKMFEKLRVKTKILGNKKYKGTEPFAFDFIEYRYNNIKSEATTSIFGDYVSIHLIKGKPIIIIIKNKDIAESYKNYFEYLWGKARK